MPSRDLLSKLLLLVVSLGLSLFGVEVLLRSLDFVDTGTTRQHRRPHRVFGWALEPGASFINEMPERAVRVDYNSGGWRDVEHGAGGAEESLRIAVLGDSFMEAYSVPFEESFHRQLKRLVESTSKATEVFNFGVGGYGTLQETLVFEQVASSFRPDLVLLGFYANDVSDNSMELQQIIFDRDFVTTAGSYSIRPFLLPAEDPTEWRTTDVDYEDAVRRLEAARGNTLGRRLVERFAIARWVSLAFGLEVSNTQSAGTSGATTTRHRTTSSHRKMAQFGIHFCQEPEAYSRAWQLTHRLLSRLEAEVADTGGQLVVFSVPSYGSVDERLKKKLRNRFPRGTICVDQAPGHRRLAQILEQESIPFIELLDSFREAAESGVTLFRASDSHWNEAGHALAAERVAAELSARGFLE